MSKLDEIESKTKDLAIDVQSQLSPINYDLKKEIKRLNSLRKEVYDTVFIKATEITEKIKLKEYKDLNADFDKLSIVDKIDDIASDNSYFINFGEFSRGEQLKYSVKRLIKRKKHIEEAKAEYERVKAESERLKTECTKKRAIVRAIGRTNRIVEQLIGLAQLSENKVVELINEKGTNLDEWSDKEVASIRTMFNLLGSISDIMNTEVFTKTGNLTSNYKKIIAGKKAEYDLLEE